MNFDNHPTRTQGSRFGWIKDTYDERDYTPEHPKVKAIFDKFKETALPDTVDLRSWCSAVQDQGNLGSCTANAGASDVEFIENKFIGNYKDASRLFIYYVTRHAIENSSGDVGAEIRDVIKELVQFGSCLETTWPYNESKFDTKPSTAAYKEALNYQDLTYVSLPDLATIKSTLANGVAVQLGFVVFSSFMNIGSNGIMPMPKTKETYEGGHAVLAVGYITINGVEYLIIENSWASSWGDKGYFYMPTAYFSKTYQGYYCVDDCWAVLTEEMDGNTPVPPTPQPDPTPTPIVDVATALADAKITLANAQAMVIAAQTMVTNQQKVVKDLGG